MQGLCFVFFGGVTVNDDQGPEMILASGPLEFRAGTESSFGVYNDVPKCRPILLPCPQLKLLHMVASGPLG